MSEDLCFLNIREIGDLLDQGKLSPVELTTAFLARIEALDAKLDAFITLTPERALADARQAETEIRSSGRRGPMHGIPYGLKDIYDTAGIATTGHSALFEDRVPGGDSTVARRLHEAGGVLMGKLATHEFAIGGPSFDLPWPPARNPWDLQRFPGGSSSGSGAGVAAGFFPCATGSDTGGSIRLPAAFCGIAGLKPTAGRVSKRGVFPLSYSLDTCGPLARTAEDCAIMLQAIAGFDPLDTGSADVPVPDFRADIEDGLSGLKIGVVRHFYAADRRASEAAIAAMADAIEVLGQAGAEIVEVTLPSLQDFHVCVRIVILAESFAIYADDMRRHADSLGQQFRYRTLPGAFLSAEDYVQALRQQRRLARRVLETLSEVDLLVTATTWGGAPRFEAMRMVEHFSAPALTSPFNASQLPAISICNGFSPEGLPLGMQIVGRPWDEATVLKAAHAYERTCAWRGRRPDLASQEKAETGHLPVEAPSGVAVEEIEKVVDRTGIGAEGEQLAWLREAWPYVEEMRAQLPRERALTDETTNLFVFPAAQ